MVNQWVFPRQGNSFCEGVFIVVDCQENGDSSDMRTIVDMHTEGLAEAIKTRFDKKTVLSIIQNCSGAWCSGSTCRPVKPKIAGSNPVGFVNGKIPFP